MALTDEASPESATKARRQRPLPPGISERISAATGEKCFQVRLRRKGYPVICRTFDSLKEAKAWQAHSLSKIESSQSVATWTDRRTTICEAIDDYTAQQLASEVEDDAWLTYVREKQRLDFLRLEFKDLAVVNLTPEVLLKWKTKMLRSDIGELSTRKKIGSGLDGKKIRQRSEGTVRKYFYALKKVLEWHSLYRKYPFESPFNVVPAPSEDIQRTRRLEAGEEDKLLAACDQMYVNQDDLKRIIGFALETAMRLGEILKIQRSEVDLLQRRIVIPKERTKTKRERQVPLSTACLALLRKQLSAAHPKGEKRLFWHWKDSNAFGHRFRLLVKNAGLNDLRFHDLRHEATSRFYENTQMTDIEIASITGHRDLRTLMRYANFRSNNLADKLG